MENTLENKAKFFAQYWGQEVLIAERYTGETKYEVSNVVFLSLVNCNSYLELKRLSSITDEEAYYIGVLFGLDKVYTHKENIIGKGIQILDYINYHPNSHCDIQKYYQLLDYLRSKGYALQWMGLSVEDMIEFGWIKLKEK